jgi:hypothetical protein
VLIRHNVKAAAEQLKVIVKDGMTTKLSCLTLGYLKAMFKFEVSLRESTAAEVLCLKLSKVVPIIQI